MKYVAAGDASAGLELEDTAGLKVAPEEQSFSGASDERSGGHVLVSVLDRCVEELQQKSLGDVVFPIRSENTDVGDPVAGLRNARGRNENRSVGVLDVLHRVTDGESDDLVIVVSIEGEDDVVSVCQRLLKDG